MSCCRGRRRRAQMQQAGGPIACQVLENSGASLKLMPLRTPQGLKLVLSGSFGRNIEISSLLSGYDCSGATAKTLKKALPKILELAESSPEIFIRYQRSGISLASLLKLAYTATPNKTTTKRQKQKSDDQRQIVSPDPTVPS